MTHIVKKTKSKIVFNITGLFFTLVFMTIFSSCEENTLPESGSISDATPPEANFSSTQGSGLGDAWKAYSFSNQSKSATSYNWKFGDGNSSNDFEPKHKYSGEGTWTVSLTAKDNLGVTSTITKKIAVKEPPKPATPNPTLINSDFTKQAKSSGSDCTCSAWINKSLGDQGESSTGNSSDVLKFDNKEPDHIYQEFKVVANADYTMKLIVSFGSLLNNTPPLPSMLETRVLAGSGYASGYKSTYYTSAKDFPQDGFGYTSISEVEKTANNLVVELTNNPNNTNYNTYTYSFNAGNNTSVALFMRGVGGPKTGSFGYNSGDEEIRIDSVTITAK